MQFLTDEEQEEIKKLFAETRRLFLESFKRYVDFVELNPDVIDVVDKFYTKDKIKELLKNSDPSSPDNPYFLTVCEFGLALGDLFEKTGKFQWIYSVPFFDSILINLETGNCIPVFDWAVKKLVLMGIRMVINGNI